MAQALPKTDASLPIALIRARESLMGPIREMLSATGLTEQQWRVLRVLDEGGPQEAQAVASGAAVSAPSLSRMLIALENRGLARRRNHPGDRRRQIVEVTESGHKIIAANQETAQAIAAQFRARLGQEKFRDLLATLAEISSWKDKS